MTKPKLYPAYHFLCRGMYSYYGEERPWKIGETRRHEGPLILFSSGYHSASTWEKAFDYANGTIACKVLVSKPKIALIGDPQVSRIRKLIDARDAKDKMIDFINKHNTIFDRIDMEQLMAIFKMVFFNENGFSAHQEIEEFFEELFDEPCNIKET